MNLEEALEYLKKGVKFSAVKEQKHIDPGLFPATESHLYEEAMIRVRMAIKSGETTEAHVKTVLGL